MDERRPSRAWDQDDRNARQRALTAFLFLAVLLAASLSLAAIVLEGEASTLAATAAVAVAVGTPLARTLWLAVRWVRKRDLRFAAAALVVLAVVALGALLGSRTG